MIKFVAGVMLAGLMVNIMAKEVVIDVRTPEEIAQTGQVQGALNDDVKSEAFRQKLSELGVAKDDDVKLYCRSGKRAGVAKDILTSLGYQHVENLGGYEDAAKKLNRPLVKP